jgi:hypothetical protein
MTSFRSSSRFAVSSVDKSARPVAPRNVLAAKLLAEPASLGAALIGQTALGRAVVEPEPGRITGAAGSCAVPHEGNVPASAQGGPQGRGVFLGSGIFHHDGGRNPQHEQHTRQNSHRPPLHVNEPIRLRI